ncbi:MAG: hypothetical protein Q6358_10870 [Candidatus Brocadiales bacterium]|nr:hypothetical protein [Candidatus Brocadiales bacterium]
MDEVTRYFEVERSPLLQRKRRVPQIARDVCMYLLKEHRGLDNKRIGEVFGVSLSAVTKAALRISEQLKKQRRLKKEAIVNVFVDVGKYIISFEIGRTLPCILIVDIYRNDGEYVDSFAIYARSENIPEIFLKRLSDLSYDDIKFFTSEIENLVKEPNNWISFLNAMQGWKVDDDRLEELGLKLPDNRYGN